MSRNTETVRETTTASGHVLSLLLGADRGKLTVIPEAKVEITRLSEALDAPAIFTVRAITQTEYKKAHADADAIAPGDKVTSQAFIIMAGLKDPNIRDEALLGMYDVGTPKDLIISSAFLLPGEIFHLYEQIAQLSGFGEDAVKAVKN